MKLPEMLTEARPDSRQELELTVGAAQGQLSPSRLLFLVLL